MELLRRAGLDVAERRPRGRNFYTVYCSDGEVYVKASHIAPVLDALGIENPWSSRKRF